MSSGPESSLPVEPEITDLPEPEREPESESESESEPEREADPEPEPERDPEPDPEPDIDDQQVDPATTLSPAVRRLVRQYDLDVTGIHGSGPAGRIRVGDVIALIGSSRTDSTSTTLSRIGDPGKTIPAVDEPLDEPVSQTPYRTSAPAAPAIVAVPRPEAAAFPTSSVFECDLSRVVAHRKQQRRQNIDVLLTSYYLVACSEALKLVPELMSDAGTGRRNSYVGVILNSADGQPRTAVVDAVDEIPLESINDRLVALNNALRSSDAATQNLGRAGLLMHHHGMSGSLITTPTLIGDGHTASLGLGRVRKQIVVRDGDDAPRVAALCYVTLSFYAERLELHRANRFLSHFVRVLEQWPE